MDHFFSQSDLINVSCKPHPASHCENTAAVIISFNCSNLTDVRSFKNRRDQVSLDGKNVMIYPASPYYQNGKLQCGVSNCGDINNYTIHITTSPGMSVDLHI